MKFKTLSLISRWAFIALTSALFAIAAHAQEPLLKLTHGTAYDLQAGSDKSVVRVPITWRQDVTAEDAKAIKPPTKTDLEFNQVRSADLLTAFTVDLQQATDTLGPALQITTDMTKAIKQGVYTLRLNVVGKDGKPELLELKLTRPAAKLSAPVPLVIEQVQPLIFGEQASVGRDVLIREVAGHLRLSDVKITQLTLLPANFEQTNATVDFEKPNPEGLAKYKLSGPFPLGSNKGTAEIVSPQLAEAVPLSFEVKARRSRWLLVIFLGLGLIAGYFLRTKLQQQIALDEARLKGRELRKTIDEVRQEHKDGVFKEKLKQILADLVKAVDQRQLSDLLNPNKMVENMNTAITTAKTAFEAAQADLKTRRDAALAAFQELLSLTQIPWSMPESVKADIKSFDVRLQEIRGQLDDSDVASAVAGLQAINTGLAEKVYPLIREWRADLTHYLEVLSNANPGLPNTVFAKMQLAVPSLTMTFIDLEPSPDNTTTANLKTLFQSLDRAYRGANDLLDKLGLWLGSYANDVIATLQKQAVQDPEVFILLVKAVKEAANNFASGVTDPHKAAEQLSLNLQKLDQAFRSAIENQIPKGATADLQATPAELQAVTKALDEYAYLEAARAVVQIIIRLKPVKPREGTLFGTAPHTIAAALAPELTLKEWSLPEGLSMGISSWLMPGPRDQTLPPIDQAIARTWLSLIVGMALRTVLVGAAITVVGFFLYYDGFVGTPKELAGMFFWAFGLDISVEALMSKVPGLTK